MTHGINKLMNGYRSYRDGAHKQSKPLIEELVKEGQHPEIAIIACSDSRVDPAILFQAEPGDLFVIRNVANLVPPLEQGGTFHGTSAAIEFAVLGLGVKHLMVLGHAHCGGIKAMMEPDESNKAFSFLPGWVSILSAAHRRVLATMPHAKHEERVTACEQNAVLVSLENLTTYPWVREKVESGELELHGLYIDIAEPVLHSYDWEAGKFSPIS